MSEHNGVGRSDALEAAQQQARANDPIFEVIIPNSIAVGVPLYHFKIWGDGHIEGFEKLGGGKALVHNRFPLLMDQVVQPLRDWVEDMNRALDELGPREPAP